MLALKLVLVLLFALVSAGMIAVGLIAEMRHRHEQRAIERRMDEYLGCSD